MTASRTSTIVPLIIGCAQFMHQFDGSVITTALPSMAASLGEDPLKLNLAITCYLLALAVFVPISGWMADRYGAKRVFIAAILVFTTSSICCGLSHSLVEIVIFRTLQGIGGAMMTPVGRVIVVKSVPKFELVRAMNYITIPAVLGPLIGPSVGGFIVTYFSWQWIFFLNLPIGLLGIVLVRVYIPDIREENVGPLDLRGFVLISIALAGLVSGFSLLGRPILPRSVVYGSLLIGAICGVLYLLHAKRSSDPIIDLGLLRIPTFSASIRGGSLFYLSTTSNVFMLALMLQLGFGLSAFHAGLLTLASAFGSVMNRATARSIIRALGFRRLLIYNALLSGAYLTFCGFFNIGTPLVVIVLVLIVGGFSRSTQFNALQALQYADMPTHLMSRTTSFAAMMQQLSQSVGVGLAALIVHLSLEWHGRTTMSPDDVSVGFFVIGAAVLSSSIIFMRMPAHAGAEITPR